MNASRPPSRDQSAPLVRSAALLCLCLAALLALAPGCGRKIWPKPVAKEDAVRLRDVAAVRQGDCMLLTGLLLGDRENLEGFTLQLARADDADCPTCPFFPTERIELGTPVWGEAGQAQRFSLTRCGLTPGPYRWRLAARSVFDVLPGDFSQVGLLP